MTDEIRIPIPHGTRTAFAVHDDAIPAPPWVCALWLIFFAVAFPWLLVDLLRLG
jgi:hypothetical protein